MFRFAVVMALMAVASAAPGFVSTYGHGAVFPGHVGFAAAPAVVKTALPVAPVAPVHSVAYTAPAVVKSAAVVAAPVHSVAYTAPAVVKAAPVYSSYGYPAYGAAFGHHLGGFGGHFGGFGGHYLH